MLSMRYLFENVGNQSSETGTLGYGSENLADINNRLRFRKPNIMGRFEVSAKLAKAFGDAGIVGGLHAQKISK